ncbi:MipA/OmpV family protein [Phaeobacter sp. J2-8]|uniref:MipA/OmpV family protein n=1 Tax=Phaeobacter sp. J2-8 TaxID=2931394 RepID=UPI001FD1373D|nr:MipA/OmpV family protein [Phaeobacter sp. J2-8]
MKNRLRRPVASLVAALIALSPALGSAEGNHIAFELGIGTKYSPDYEGADTYKAGPTIQGGLHSLSFGGVSAGGGETTGFRISPSFGFVSARDASEHDDLKGMDDVDWALELGIQAGYTWENAEVSAAIRKGINGHDGIVGDLKANAILRPDALTTLRFGPRVTFGDDNYADTYFSVPASASNLSPYSADGGVKSYGLELIARRELTDTWAIEGKLGWHRLTNDFADSPVTGLAAKIR